MKHCFVKKMMMFLITCILCQLYASETRIGFSTFYHNATGEIEKYIACNVGIGVNVEFSVSKYFGFLVQLETAGNFFSSSRIESLIDLTEMAGIWFRVPLGSYFALQPELAYGIVVHCLYPSKTARNVKNYYLDQQIRGAVGFRITPVHCNFEIDIAPVYTIFFEKDYTNHYFGGRLVFFKHLQ